MLIPLEDNVYGMARIGSSMSIMDFVSPPPATHATLTLKAGVLVCQIVLLQSQGSLNFKLMR